MMNLTVSNGIVRRGRYETLEIHGACTFEPGVRFTTLFIDGSLSAPECIGSKLVCVGGKIFCLGTMRVGAISGYGSMRVRGALRCDSLEFTGLIDSSQDLLCRNDIEFNGRLRNGRVLRADRMELNGVLHGHELEVRTFDLKPLHGAILRRYAMNEYLDESHADRVSGSSVHAEKLRCRFIEAQSVHLSDECQVERVSYSAELVRDRSSSVSLVDFKGSAPFSLNRA